VGIRDSQGNINRGDEKRELSGWVFPPFQQLIDAVFAGADKNQTQKNDSIFDGMCGSTKPIASA